MIKKVKITDLLPLLKPGYVAMDSTCEWYWYENKPKLAPVLAIWMQEDGKMQNLTNAFNIVGFRGEWDTSLIKVDKK